ncbi:MAG: hypothetical protein K8J08_01910 [Thermoanaerobaculia bacterium]|nr:hypothetical protein [Thermoanaerobaculia bacterium]
MPNKLRQELPPAAHKYFYARERTLTEQLAAIGSLVSAPQPVGGLVQAFHENLEAAIRVAETPTAVAIAAAFPPKARRSKLGSHDLVLRLGTGPREEPRPHVSKEESLDVLQAYHALLSVGGAGDIADLVTDPLRQGTVLLWAALEYAANEAFAQLFERVPAILRSESPDSLRLHKLLSIKTADALTLEAPGAWFAENRRRQSYYPLRALVSHVFPAHDKLLTAFANREVELCAARRNVIAHRAGLVDAKYIALSGESLKVGSLIVVTPRTFSLQVAAIAIAAGELVVATVQRLDNGAR